MIPGKPGQLIAGGTQTGVAVEVRALDLNPFLPLGIDAEQSRFLDSFLLYCLLADSPGCSPEEYDEIGRNVEAVVAQGRDPQLNLSRSAEQVKLTDWANELLEDISYSAGLLDSTHNGSAHSVSLGKQVDKVANPDLTPSGRLLADMQESGKSFYKLAMWLSQQHQHYFTGTAIDSKNQALLEAASSVSLERQKEIEESDTIDFEAFLREWNAYHI